LNIYNIGLILISAGFHALWNILTRLSDNSPVFSGIKGTWLLIFSLVFFFIEGLPPQELWFWGIISGVLHALYIFCLSRAYSMLEISYVYPIARSAPAFVPGVAFLLLDERIAWQSFFGITLILTGIYYLHFEARLIQGFSKVWDAIVHKDLRWAFLTLVMVVSYSIWDKYSMKIYFTLLPNNGFSNGISFFLMEAGICFFLYNLYLAMGFSRREILDRIRMEWAWGFIGAVATLGSYGLICVVLQYEAVSKVVALRQTSVLMVVYWGGWQLGEPFGKQRSFSAILILVGAILIGWKAT
tara:strand:- start:1976 stop:2872 length:897 start_codon:yes stop_codon:yes gene_type:complete